MTRTIDPVQRGLKIGAAADSAGDVTQLISLVNVDTAELEQRIGYKAGRLRLGWYLLLLDQGVGQGEFRWGETTASSNGTDGSRPEEFAGENFRVPVQDLLRYDLYKAADHDEGQAEASLNRFLAHQQQLLNVRAGSNRIAKVVPYIAHADQMFWLDQYPDAAPAKSIRQWTLTSKKRFIVQCFVPGGHRYLGGGARA